ncbi:MAG: acyltransferase [Anaerolineales bacterium]|nr:acyltransferase [Anaerolineales bacterium]
MGINQLIEKFVSRLGKHQNFALDEQLTGRDRLFLSRQMGGWALRGFWRRLWFKQAKGLVLIGAKVQIRYPHYLQVGKNFIVEDGAEIMALSQEGIICGDNVTIGAYASIKPTSYYGRNLGVGLRIGDHSNIGRYSYIGCSGRITIGNNVMMGPRVGLFAENHRFTDTERLMREQGVEREPIRIEDDCWLASSSTILAGVTIGQGAIVAAGSVVTQDVAPYSIVAGSPAKLIRSRLNAEKGPA